MGRFSNKFARYLKSGDRIRTDRFTGIIENIDIRQRHESDSTLIVFAWMKCDNPNSECFRALAGYSGGHSHPITVRADSLILTMTAS